jgi:hypothetical protein
MAVKPQLPYARYAPNLYPSCGAADRDADGECLGEPIAEVRLHRANAGFGGEFTAHGLDRAAVGDAEQGNGGVDQWEILRLGPP